MTSDLSSIDDYDGLGFTPLLSAIFIGDINAVESLQKQGTDSNKPQRDDPSESPLWHADEDFGLHEIAALLKTYGASSLALNCHEQPLSIHEI